MTVRPSTLLGALAAIGAVAALVRLSTWQWERGTARGSLLNYACAVEWMSLAVGLVAAVLLRGRHGTRPPSSDGSRGMDGRIIGPPLRSGEKLPPPTTVQVKRGCGDPVNQPIRTVPSVSPRATRGR